MKLSLSTLLQPAGLPIVGRSILGATMLVAIAVANPNAAAPASPKAPDGVILHRDLAYVQEGHSRQKLDLYLPENGAGPLPVIVWVHGGGWAAGSKDECGAKRFAQKGYAVASIGYRLSGDAIFPAQIEDCKAAIRWLRAHAKDYRLDPERFAAWGSSAGGHLVALLGTSGDAKEFDVGAHLDQSSRVQAVCDFYGPTDLLQMDAHAPPGARLKHNAPQSPESRLIGGPIQQNKEKAARANPIAYISKSAPPFLIVHGSEDATVPLHQSQLLYDALKSAGARVRFHTLEGAGHGIGFGGPELEAMLNGFFERHLKGVAPANDEPLASATRGKGLAVPPQSPGASSPPNPKTPARPNIVFILADDLGWADLGCYGADLHETPHLDRLAREGVRFTQAYTMSVCTPTRAAILAGKHAARLHMTVWRESSVQREEQSARSRRKLLPPVTVHDLPHSEVTLAESLKAAGYLTFHVGKWHLGDGAHAPETHGFDVNIGGTHWGAPNSFFWPFSSSNTFREFRYVPGLGLGKPGDYLTDRLTDEAIKLVDAAGERPFFLNLWFHNPHTPIEGKPDLVERYRAKLKPGLRHQNPDYGAMIHTLDENVGRLLAHLDRRGLAQRTLVVFTSDNGGYIGEFKGVRVTDNAPLRSGKSSLYEGGIRVPLIARLPGLTPAGAVSDVPVQCMDFFRTFAGLAGAQAETAEDGVDLLPVLRDPRATLPRDALFFHYPHYYHAPPTTPVSAVRAGDWKLLEHHEDSRVELFNLKNDPGETRNLAGEFPQEVAQLRERLHNWQKSVSAQPPVPNPNFQGKR